MTEAQRDSRVLPASSLVAVGMMAMNVLTYGFTLLAAHLMAPASFGGISALLGVLITANVGALALQATAARRTATAPAAQRADVAHDVVVSAWTVALALTTLFLMLSPVLVNLLHVPVTAAVLVALCVGPLTMIGGYSGVLQGSRRWSWLGVTYVGIGAGRFAAGGIALALDPSVTSAMAGITVGNLLPAMLSYLGCRDVPHHRAARHLPVLREVWRNGHTLLAFFAVTNVDVLLARLVFSLHDSGLYAAGAVLAKACLFLPQFVIIVAFPGMAESQMRDRYDREWLRPLGLVVVIGMAVVLGAALLPSLAVAFIGGAAYSELQGFLWMFALEGTGFAVLQMIVYRQIARQARLVAWILWCGLAALVTLAVTADTIGKQGLVLGVLATIVLLTIPVALVRPALRSSS